MDGESAFSVLMRVPESAALEVSLCVLYAWQIKNGQILLRAKMTYEFIYAVHGDIRIEVT